MTSKAFVIAVVLALLGLSITAHADVFNLGEGFTNLETVAVGDAGNTGELSGAGAGGEGPDRICGSVGYNYNIGKYEVTAKQYTDFLNNKAQTDDYGLYSTGMWDYSNGCKIQQSGTSGSYTYSVANDWANKPVNFVNYWAARRFTNWLNNGQGDGDTETGAYTLHDNSGNDDHTIQRNAGAKWFIPSEDEWYKAAYYTGSGYSKYANGTNTEPTAGVNTNYHNASGAPWNVGTGTMEQNGTYDMMGNILEWNEAIIFPEWTSPPFGLRGGNSLGYAGGLQASNRGSGAPGGYLAVDIGFRVAYMPDGGQPVPECPSAILAILGSVCGVGGTIWKRRAR